MLLMSSDVMYLRNVLHFYVMCHVGWVLLQVTTKYSQIATVLTKKKLEAMSAAHITLAHKLSHGVPALAAYAPLRGTETQVQLTAFLYSEKLIALEVHLNENGERPVESKNTWPHITVCMRNHFLYIWTFPDGISFHKLGNNTLLLIQYSKSTVLKALEKFKGLQHEDKSSSAMAWKIWEGQEDCTSTP